MLKYSLEHSQRGVPILYLNLKEPFDASELMTPNREPFLLTLLSTVFKKRSRILKRWRAVVQNGVPALRGAGSQSRDRDHLYGPVSKRQQPRHVHMNNE